MIEAITTIVSVGVDESHVAEHPGEHGRGWKMRVRRVRIVYRWTRDSYWKTVESTIKGTPIEGPCPDEYTYERGNVQKPLWLAGLELRHYPRS